MKRPFTLAMWASILLFVGCDRQETPHADHDEHTAGEPAPTNRIDIPANVRQNLGITFAKVESRAVARTLRLPGAFELIPTATREYRAAAAGRVEVLVRQYERVEVGQPLYRIDSPRLRELQQQLADAASALALAEAAVASMPPFFDAHEKHHAEIEKSVALWSERVEQLSTLRNAGGGQAADLATANASLAQARAAFAETLEKEADLNARKAETDARLAAAKQRGELLFATLASLTGRPMAELTSSGADGKPAWQGLNEIEVRAAAPGVVTAIGTTNGAHVEEAAGVVTIIAPDQLRFRARGYQSDLGRLRDGLPSRVVAASDRESPNAEAMRGSLAIVPHASADTRTIDLIVTPDRIAPWAIAGVAGFVEVTLAGTDGEELAVPMSCVVRDGLTPVLFRRDPRAPDKAIRMEADVGVDDGRWVVIKSGVAEGNEIVQDGAYQLLVATSGSIQKGGHFHSDGTFHEGKD